jgi:phosphonate degradation associated HDIG domain protein
MKRASGASDAEQVVDALLARIAGGGARDYLGERVSQLEHALQTAHFARAAGAGDDLVVAALLHDVGHLCSEEGIEPATDFGLTHHDAIGAAFLRSIGFSSEIASLVQGHVRAKRYLVARRSGYAERLSAASRRTLVLQGSALNEAEADAFERQPTFASLLRLRQWDERGKVPGLEVAPLESYRALLVTRLLPVRDT